MCSTVGPCLSILYTVVLSPACSVAQLCPTFCNPIDGSPPAPLSMKFSRQEYWNGLPFPTPGDLSNPGIEPESSALAGGFFTN